MAIYPITVTRLPMFVILGHSNADGWAPTDRVIANNPSLAPGSLNPENAPEKSYYKNIYVPTTKQPYPTQVTGDVNVPIPVAIGDVEWLELTIANTLQPDDPHPHPSPYQYPNNQGACYPHFNYYAWSSSAGLTRSTFATTPLDPLILGVRSGVELPLAWYWRNHWGQQVGFTKLAFSSSSFLPADNAETTNPGINFLDPFFAGSATPNDPTYVRSAAYLIGEFTPADPAGFGTPYDFYGWWTPNEMWDFAPQTERLYQRWYDRMVGAAAALPAGTKMDVQLIIPWMGDNDSLFAANPDRLRNFEQFAKNFIDRIRQDCVDNDWTTLPKDQIPVIIPNVFSTYVNAPAALLGVNTRELVNDAYAAIAQDDEMVRILDTSSWSTMEDEGFDLIAGVPGAGTHFGVEGYQDAANAIYDAWVDMREDYFDALDQEETKTVGQAIDQIRLYYAKSRSNTDLTREMVLQHLNGAMYHVFNHVGDNAWWLRRRMPLTISGGPTSITTMPRYVKRLLKIESASDPNYPIMFTQVGHGSGGRLQIHMDERGTGSFMCSFITNPRELTSDSQIVPAPRQILEWIVVEACRRIAASSSNAPLQAHFSSEAMQLMSDCMRNAGHTQRSKNDVMRTQRRRPRFGYGRGSRSNWWGTDSSL